MNRKEFVIKCASCLGLGGLALLAPGCAGTRYFSALIEGADLIIPKSEFSSLSDDGKVTQRKYVIAHNDKLEYPIYVYDVGNDSYTALWMQCTHQGTELQAFGDRLQCPAHGSEFTNYGLVQNGPADKNLRSFPVKVDGGNLRISLS
jgi:Rieske Fe-S protein